MIEKLLALFIHAKSGAISGVFLLGASGALVSATTENGVTTITITQASPSPSASVSPSPSASTSPVPSASPSPAPSASPSASPSPSPSPTPSASPSASATPSAPAAHACVDAVRTVNDAFQERHTTLSKMRSGKSERGDRAARSEAAAKLTVKRADEILKAIRKAAVKSIHASCPSSHDDDDEDDEDNDDEDDDRDEHDDRASSSELLFTGTPAEIATQATAAMDLVMQAVAAQSPLPESRDDDDDDDDDKDRKQKDKEQGNKGKGKRK